MSDENNIPKLVMCEEIVPTDCVNYCSIEFKQDFKLYVLRNFEKFK